MIVNEWMKKPVFINEAASQSCGRSLWLEILIFFVVFLAGGILQEILMIIPTIVIFFSSESFQSLLSKMEAGEQISLMEWLSLLELPDSLVLVTLFATVGTIAAVLLYVHFIEKRKLYTMGLTRTSVFSEYGIGLAVGIVMFSAVIGLNVLFGGLSYAGALRNGGIAMVLFMFLGYIVQGASEELLCRGYFFVSAARRSSLLVAMLANSVLFALLHAANVGISWLALLNLLLFGIFASFYMVRRGNIWGICAIHTMWNFAQGNIFGLQVSGTGSTASIFSFVGDDGKAWINGGSFGPEGGICVTIVLLISILILLPMKNKDKGFPTVSEKPGMEGAADS